MRPFSPQTTIVFVLLIVTRTDPRQSWAHRNVGKEVLMLVVKQMVMMMVMVMCVEVGVDGCCHQRVHMFYAVV